MTSSPFFNENSKLINELHARPFLSMQPGGRVSYLVFEHVPGEDSEIAHNALCALCEHLGVDVPAEARRFFWHDFGDFIFKWERHTEFTSYLIFDRSAKEEYFSEDSFGHFPQSWLEARQSKILTSAIIEITKSVSAADYPKVLDDLRSYFVAESLAVAQVLEGAAVIASDFQTDAQGHMRFTIIPSQDIGGKRLGRISQRLLEIETYVVGSLRGLPPAREMARELPQYEAEFLPIIAGISSDKSSADVSLQSLLMMASKIEQTISEVSFRFGASLAYADLVHQRIAVLREERLGGFQLFSEFMLRRYEPGMRTIRSTWERLQGFSERLARAATFLRTKVDVGNADGQRALLDSMNERAETQLRLQETVEGLSVVAISYYAVSLVGYLLAPFGKSWGLDKTWLMAIAVPPVVLAVWLFVRSIKHHVVHKDES